MTTIALAVFVAGFLAYANGANDNFKGVATLFGTGTTTYRRALLWASITTALGSLTALVLAKGLLAAFSGKGLVPDAVVAMPSFPLAVGLAAAATVLLATRLGFPISTTHALIGALVGTGIVASPSGIVLARLGKGFVVPLLFSPFLALLLALVLYPAFRFARRRLRVDQETCVCVGKKVIGVVPGTPSAEHAIASVALTVPAVELSQDASCMVRYNGTVFGVNARRMLDALHYVSAGMVSFARGLNDTPKIAALLLIGGAISPSVAILIVGAAIALGGLISSRRVAETMSLRVTQMNPGQGFTANLVTAFLVVVASRFGVPVSTTHVSCGSLFGIGAATRQADWKTIRQILLAWLITLPVAGVLGAVCFFLIRAALS